MTKTYKKENTIEKILQQKNSFWEQFNRNITAQWQGQTREQPHCKPFSILNSEEILRVGVRLGRGKSTYWRENTSVSARKAPYTMHKTTCRVPLQIYSLSWATSDWRIHSTCRLLNNGRRASYIPHTSRLHSMFSQQSASHQRQHFGYARVDLFSSWNMWPENQIAIYGQSCSHVSWHVKCTLKSLRKWVSPPL